MRRASGKQKYSAEYQKSRKHLPSCREKLATQIFIIGNLSIQVEYNHRIPSEKVIELLHADLDWDGIPNLEQIDKRFENDSEFV